jgi:hypothetical protein
MRRVIFSLCAVAVLGFAGAACERHSARELTGGHEGSPPKGEHVAAGGQQADPAAPHTPPNVPKNPAGAAPVSDQLTGKEPGHVRDGKPDTAAAPPVSATPVPRFFPDSK